MFILHIYVNNLSAEARIVGTTGFTTISTSVKSDSSDYMAVAVYVGIATSSTITVTSLNTPHDWLITAYQA